MPELVRGIGDTLLVVLFLETEQRIVQGHGSQSRFTALHISSPFLVIDLGLAFLLVLGLGMMWRRFLETDREGPEISG